MGSEDKLQQFYENIIRNINEKAEGELTEYAASLQPQLEEYKNMAAEAALRTERIEAENLKKAARQEVSKEVIVCKSLLAQREADYIEKIFAQALEMIGEFKKTQEYKKLIKRYIYEAIEFAKEAELIIYLDLDDAEFKEELEEEFGREIRVSRYSFGGGLRALIPERNILIENSFSSKLQEQLQTFDIDA